MTTVPILVCDPDPQMQRALRVILGGVGHKVLSAATGKEALEFAAREQPLAVILELALPDLGGIELCQRLRDRGQMPILVLSAIDNEAAKIKALQSGADDYLTKPFSRGELVARLAARLRAAPSELRFELDGLTIDLVAHRVTIDGDEVHLTPIEFALLRVLATSRGPVTHQALAASVWGTLHSDPASRVRTHIRNLRAKLDPDQHRNPIRTEVAIGYRFARPAHASSPLTDAAPAAP
jgi:two-component system KDP operon response regulator KdpE